MTRHRRSISVRDRLFIAEEQKQFIKAMQEALERQGGDLDDLFKVILGPTNDAECLARAIMNRLAIYEIDFNRVKGNLAHLFSRSGVMPRFGELVTHDWSQPIPGGDSLVMGFPDIRELFFSTGDNCMGYAQLARAWKDDGRFPATLEQVLQMKIEKPDLEIWEDAIIIFGTDLEYPGSDDQRIELSDDGSIHLKLVGSELMAAVHYIQMCDSGKRVAYIQT